ncbi:LAME_0D11364g1_1 [Lachancea meyersii CBS 8951]|uniref:LAME_0D11364g1_1 n=1 Tax=Lachancea meyersii CBS 8951 TaxID=1266667 RepID=A0A1G4JCY1_9SACH|nr:LAME_0D11364g1_1 [Lachancea meyersii CBS 8951]
MSYAAPAYPKTIPCGTAYNLTIDANTSAIEGWWCADAILSNYDTRVPNLTYSEISLSCHGNQFLTAYENTTVVEGLLCGLGLYSSNSSIEIATKKNDSDKNGVNWIHLMIVGSVFAALVF